VDLGLKRALEFQRAFLASLAEKHVTLDAEKILVANRIGIPVPLFAVLP
jgi:hypothetical protein